MPIKQIFEYSWPENVQPVTFDEWIKSLTVEEQNEYRRANHRQKMFRLKELQSGNLVVKSNEYQWKNEKALAHGKEIDNVWFAFFTRYLEETQTTFTVKEEIV